MPYPDSGERGVGPCLGNVIAGFILHSYLLSFIRATYPALRGGVKALFCIFFYSGKIAHFGTSFFASQKECGVPLLSANCPLRKRVVMPR